MGFEGQLHEFENKWQERWNNENVFTPEPDDRESFFITVAYPYPSGGMHIGHVGTYTLPDVFARFQRMLGKNVLFPMGWHVTGTPIIGAVNRLKDGEQKQRKVLKETYNVPEKDLEQLKTPMGYATYFINNSYKKNMNDLGFSVDWRREFTTNDNRYNTFIEWQYETLRDQGFVKKGKHPTKYCIVDKNPVTTHDLLEGEDAAQQEYTLVLFNGDGVLYPMATLRPETVFGVTHALINPDARYVRAKVNGSTWIISEEAVEKLKHQDKDVIVQEELEGVDLIGRNITNPVTGDEILLLPAPFVDPDSGSGLVMSVPAHAPYDWISLQNLKDKSDNLETYGITPSRVKDIEPIQIIDIDGFNTYPAKQACKKSGITSQTQDNKLEAATETLYEKEFHHGVLNDKCGSFSGQAVENVKEKLIDVYEQEGVFDTMWDFSEEVICRCGGKVIVAQSDTWFLEYGDPAWKDVADQVLGQLETVPADTRQDYEHTINWLESWPCIRNYGLGTALPFDKQFKVEPLSDSTVYMAYYTIKHIIDDVEPEKLTKRFYDYVFRGNGPLHEVVKQTGVDKEIVKKARESFEYWYPLDWRTSANELVQNHLTFFMYHHGALFDKKHWPNGVAAWGMGLLEGKKMSSSKGHVVLAKKAIKKYGADTVRFFMFASCEPWQDFDWRREEVQDYKNKLEAFFNRSIDLYGSGNESQISHIDNYVLSKLQHIKEDTREALENFQTRKAALRAFFDLNNIINWYRERTDTVTTTVINRVIDAQIRMMAPFIPHTCEELWERIGNDGIVATAKWPEKDNALVRPNDEAGESLVKAAIDDIREIESLVDEYGSITLITAASWKRQAVHRIRTYFEENGSVDVGSLMDTLSNDEELRKQMDQLPDLVQQFVANPGDLPDMIMDDENEKQYLSEASEFLEDRFDARVEVVSESESNQDKASRAMPGKPAIILE